MKERDNLTGIFGQEPELSSDLDWMLQGHQASKAMVLDRLLRDYYVPIDRLARSLLNDPNVAEEAVREILAVALLETHRYQAVQGVDAWINGIAWRVCQARLDGFKSWVVHGAASNPSTDITAPGFAAPANEKESALWGEVDRLGGRLRVPLILHYVLAWSVPRIARILGLEERTVLGRLSRARLQIQNALGDTILGEKDPEAFLARSLQRRWPAVQLSEDHLDKILGEIQTRSERKAFIDRRVGNFKELALLVGVALFALILFRAGSFTSKEAAPIRAPYTPRSVAATLAAGRRLTETSRAAHITPLPSTPTPTPTPTPLPTSTPIPAGVFYIVRYGDTLQSVAASLNTSAETLRKLNRIPAGMPLYLGQALVIPGSRPSGLAPTPTLVTTVAPVEPLKPPVTSDEIVALLQGGGQPYHSLWLDAQILTHGPPDESGAPQIERIQFWLGEQQALLLGGPAGMDPAQVMLWDGQQTYIAEPGQNQPWFQLQDPGKEPILDINLRYGVVSLFQAVTERSPGSSYTLIGEDRLAGRDAWKIEKLNAMKQREEMLWIDQRTGFVLRFQDLRDTAQMAQPGETRMPDEIVVTAIDFDVNFPPELFDLQLPWRGGYALDYTGVPLPLDAPKPAWKMPPGVDNLSFNLPPKGFDPSHSLLAFRFPLSFSLATSMAGTDLFADGYYLGRVDMGIPWNLWCQRSPNGSLIAFTDPSRKEGEMSLSLSGPYYFSLFDPQSVHEALPNATQVSSDFAFSPDSRYLAFWGCQGSSDNCGVYLHDTQTQKYQRLIQLTHGATYFVWSPDGQYLAMLGANNSFFVVRVRDGEITYKGPYDPGFKAVPPDAPVYSWGKAFPPEIGGLETCALPPGH